MRRVMKRIAMVTGGNRGIGFAVCRGLAQAGLQVIMGSRDEDKGNEAVKALGKQGFSVDTHQLDVTDPTSISAIKEYILRQYGRLDVLINNAGVHLDKGESVLEVPLDIVRQTFEINLFGALNVSRTFLSIMKQHNYGRVVNVSSDMGSLSKMSGRSGAYRISKAALNALTRVIASEIEGYNIKVNTMAPGWVRTDMGGPSAPRSPEQGADTIIWLATLPDEGPTGGFFKDRESIPW
jgi:NAD(P)-dependent dehydrogenase (short-subunit alcohol dehydrogenase family)